MTPGVDILALTSSKVVGHPGSWSMSHVLEHLTSPDIEEIDAEALPALALEGVSALFAGSGSLTANATVLSSGPPAGGGTLPIPIGPQMVISSARLVSLATITIQAAAHLSGTGTLAASAIQAANSVLAMSTLLLNKQSPVLAKLTDGAARLDASAEVISKQSSDPIRFTFPPIAKYMTPSTGNAILEFIRIFSDQALNDPLADYYKLNQPDWDGYGAEPLTRETLNYARKLLRALPDTFGPPDIAPSGDGSVALEWVPKTGPIHKLFLDIGPGEEWRAYWKRRNGEFGRLPGKSFTPNTKQILADLFAKLSV